MKGRPQKSQPEIMTVASVQKKNQKSRKGNESQSCKAQFNSILNEVRKKAKLAMDPEQIKDFENARLRALGVKVEKNKRIPFPEFLKKRQEIEQKHKEILEEEKRTGVKMHVGKYADTYAAQKAKERKARGIARNSSFKQSSKPSKSAKSVSKK
eukprot:Protomagalhaensia_wolfi_Nauph_80__5257@NODE_566_length_2279_cov_719_388839_g422_i0_p2_GENE_NODE_566_length_2279_cov_719_388839_g422_i0NODE_566_length_2279_cov_719_388839_g422_i0_p2_ORF_typecomplete_len154_score36_51DUF4602/PF15375_6/6_4e07DUF4602/PF15375_6/2_8e02_NODE_566_length_2279_cov_719_388839_g422_i028489